jgi:hypothetical protein
VCMPTVTLTLLPGDYALCSTFLERVSDRRAAFRVHGRFSTAGLRPASRSAIKPGCEALAHFPVREQASYNLARADQVRRLQQHPLYPSRPLRESA